MKTTSSIVLKAVMVAMWEFPAATKTNVLLQYAQSKPQSTGDKRAFLHVYNLRANKTTFFSYYV